MTKSEFRITKTRCHSGPRAGIQKNDRGSRVKPGMTKAYEKDFVSSLLRPPSFPNAMDYSVWVAQRSTMGVRHDWNLCNRRTVPHCFAFVIAKEVMPRWSPYGGSPAGTTIPISNNDWMDWWYPDDSCNHFNHNG